MTVEEQRELKVGDQLRIHENDEVTCVAMVNKHFVFIVTWDQCSGEYLGNVVALEIGNSIVLDKADKVK